MVQRDGRGYNGKAVSKESLLSRQLDTQPDVELMQVVEVVAPIWALRSGFKAIKAAALRAQACEVRMSM